MKCLAPGSTGIIKSQLAKSGMNRIRVNAAIIIIITVIMTIVRFVEQEIAVWYKEG